MSAKRELTMRQLRHMLRLAHEGVSAREMGRRLGVAREHAEWLGVLLEYELTLKRQKRFEARARSARLRQAAAVEDVDYQGLSEIPCMA